MNYLDESIKQGTVLPLLAAMSLGELAKEWKYADHPVLRHLASKMEELCNSDTLNRAAKLEKNQTPLAIQVGGDHYKNKLIQPVEYLQANPEITFCPAQIIKYASRLGQKGGKAGALQDLEKIKHYADLYKQLVVDKMQEFED